MREAAWNEVFHSQAHYRALLDSMARPGKINSLERVALHTPAGFDWASASVALSLLDSEVTFSALSAPEGTGPYLAANTGAREADEGSADFQFTEGFRAAESIHRAKPGTLLYPEDGATLIIGVRGLSAEPVSGSIALKLRRAGIEQEARLWVQGMTSLAFDELKEKNAEYPLGVDTVLCCDGPHSPLVACIPRTTAIHWTF